MSSHKMKAQKLHKQLEEKMSNRGSIEEVSSSIRESRQGFRGFGMFQLSKYYAAEGVHVIDIGGPPVAGR